VRLEKSNEIISIRVQGEDLETLNNMGESLLEKLKDINGIRNLKQTYEGTSGIMSFLIGHDGVLYEKHLTPDSVQAAINMISFEPDDGWIRSEEIP
jgi:Cu/Ag efflux pump CusA